MQTTAQVKKQVVDQMVASCKRAYNDGVMVAKHHYANRIHSEERGAPHGMSGAHYRYFEKGFWDTWKILCGE